MGQFFKKHWKKLVFIALMLALIGVIFVFFSSKNNQDGSQTSSNSQEQPADQESSKTVFTSKIFDPALVNFITPLGELNGGYIETQTINGVTVNLKMDAKGNAPEIEVYAPTDMILEDYSYFTGGKETPNYHMGFRISKDIKLSFDHITSVSDELKEVMPPTETSGYVSPKKKISFKAGEVIAKTSGTDKAHNWNIYLRDNSVTNTFVNQERFEKIKNQYDFVNAACPFNYYEESIKLQFLALMGFSAPGQSKTCGTNSKDVKGTISGMWFLTDEGIKESYEGDFATPFSVYKTSSEQIIIYEIDRQRFILDNKNKTYKDPAVVTTEHCYGLSEFGGSSTKGYAYFKVTSDMEMKVAYNASGSCPGAFPENISKTYYR